MKMFDKIKSYFNNDISSNKIVALSMSVSAICFSIMIVDPREAWFGEEEKPEASETNDFPELMESLSDNIIRISALFYINAIGEDGFVGADTATCDFNEDNNSYVIISGDGVEAPMDVAHHFIRTTTDEGVGYSEFCTALNKGFDDSIKFSLAK